MADGHSGSKAARRYPALVWLAAAGALALLLPSGLTLPQSGPPTLAELAPVPGQGQGAGDLGEIGHPSSDGLGLGSGTGPGGPGTSVAGGDAGPLDDVPGETGRIVRKPGTKRCVGKPARQTEDPLSPPCLAFFEGDNGGATATGVSRAEVVVLFQVDSVTNDPKAGQVADCGLPVSDDDDDEERLCKGWMAFFNDRYQTYGRKVHLYYPHFMQAAQLTATLDRYQPFAVVANGSSATVARRGIMAAGFLGDRRDTYRAVAPFKVTYRQDVEDQLDLGASFLCRKLAGRPARWSGEVLDRDDVRRFGFLIDAGRDQRQKELRARIREQCGLDIATVAAMGTDGSGLTQLRAAGVTTVVHMVENNTNQALASNHAVRIGWFPEWFLPGYGDPRNIDTNFYGRLANQAAWANAFGLTFDQRREAVRDQPWFRAFREGCATCPEPTAASSSAFAYDALSMFFYGLQAAGPRLSPETFDRGMHAIPPKPSDDPFRPAAYFAPGNYSFVKDAMTIRWDPSGQPPGTANAGCYRLPTSGLRHRVGEWPEGDDDLAPGRGPCQGDAFQ